MQLPKSALFDLISSLSAVEKANFKKFGIPTYDKTKAVYIDLFDTFNGQKKYNETEIKTKIIAKHKLSNFSQIKQQLYLLVLEYFSSNNKEFFYLQASKNLQYAYYLKRKGDYMSEISFLSKNYEWVKEGKISGKMALDTLENLLIAYRRYNGFNEEINELFQWYEKYVEAAKVEFEMDKLRHDLRILAAQNFYFALDDETLNKLNQLKPQLQQLSYEQISKKAEFTRMANLRDLAMIHQDKELFAQLHEQQIRFLEKNGDHKNHNISLYRNQLITGIEIAGELDHSSVYLDKRKQFLSYLEQEQCTLEQFQEPSRDFFYLVDLKASAKFNLADIYQKSLTYCKNVIDTGEILSQNLQLQTIPVLCEMVLAKKHDDALDLIDLILANGKKFGENYGIEVFAQLMRIQCHFDLGNHGLVSNLCINFKRSKILKQDCRDFIDFTLKLILKACNVPKSEVKLIFQTYLKKLNNEVKNPSSELVMQAFHFTAWIKKYTD